MKLYRFEFSYLAWPPLVVHVVADDGECSLTEMERLARLKLAGGRNNTPIEQGEVARDAELVGVTLENRQVIVDARSYAEDESVLR